MVFKMVLSVVVLIVALLVFAATKPNSFRVQRSITIHASQEKVFPFINDLRSWEAWSSDTGGDGTVQKIYSGPASGTGAAAEWNGSGRAGAAKMMIVASVAPSKVSVQVDWFKPFKAHNLNEFTFHAQGDETEVRPLEHTGLEPVRHEGDGNICQHAICIWEAHGIWPQKPEECGRKIRTELVLLWLLRRG